MLVSDFKIYTKLGPGCFDIIQENKNIAFKKILDDDRVKTAEIVKQELEIVNQNAVITCVIEYDINMPRDRKDRILEIKEQAWLRNRCKDIVFDYLSPIMIDKENYCYSLCDLGNEKTREILKTLTDCSLVEVCDFGFKEWLDLTAFELPIIVKQPNI